MRVLWTILLLVGSNVFMTTAWYYHLKKKETWPLTLAIGLSWLIALPEYCLQVPANRLGHATLTAAQLKVLQEAITLVVFAGFSVWVLRERLRWTDGVGFALVMAGVAVVMLGKKGAA